MTGWRGLRPGARRRRPGRGRRPGVNMPRASARAGSSREIRVLRNFLIRRPCRRVCPPRIFGVSPLGDSITRWCVMCYVTERPAKSIWRGTLAAQRARYCNRRSHPSELLDFAALRRTFHAPRAEHLGFLAAVLSEHERRDPRLSRLLAFRSASMVLGSVALAQTPPAPPVVVPESFRCEQSAAAAVPRLINDLKSKEEQVRAKAIATLGSLGKIAKPAAPAL